MIKNNSLSDRLNQFRNKEATQSNNSTESSEPTKPQYNSILELLVTVYSIINTVTRIIVFGYASKFIFNTDWNFLSILCVGFLINYTFSFIYSIFSIKNK
jgi:hypothetical protein